jgi:hypothetical protein
VGLPPLGHDAVSAGDATRQGDDGRRLTSRSGPAPPIRRGEDGTDRGVHVDLPAAGTGIATLRARVLREAALVILLTAVFAAAGVHWDWPELLGGPVDDVVLVLAFRTC